MKIIPAMTPKDITQEHWYAMCGHGLSMPEPLNKADMKKPFMYQRGLGFMYCSGGHHAIASGVLLAFEMGLMCSIDAQKEMKTRHNGRPFDCCAMMDYWILNTEGTAFKSSVSKTITAGFRGSLNAFEIRQFGEHNIRYLTEGE